MCLNLFTSLRNVYQSKHGAVGLSSYDIGTFKVMVEYNILISIPLRMSSHSGESGTSGFFFALDAGWALKNVSAKLMTLTLESLIT